MAGPFIFSCPIHGSVAPLSHCEDASFSQGKLGRGVLLLPAAHTLLSPAEATVYFSFTTKHAVGLQTPQGVQFILHVGLDTYKLQGEGFQLHVRTGDQVSRGQPLLSFDPQVLASAGYSPVIPFVFCNAANRRLTVLKLGPIAAGEDLLLLH